MSPCLMCIEKSCNGCPCAVAEIIDNEQHDSNLMKTALLNPKDCNAFLMRLSLEVKDLEWKDNGVWKVLAQNWRGFPAYSLSEATLTLWINNHYQKLR